MPEPRKVWSEMLKKISFKLPECY